MSKPPKPATFDTPLSRRLVKLMDAMDWQQADLVRVSRQDSSVISQWLGKGSKEIHRIGKVEAAVYLERATGFSALWIADGEGPERVGDAWQVTGGKPAPRRTSPACGLYYLSIEGFR